MDIRKAKQEDLGQIHSMIDSARTRGNLLKRSLEDLRESLNSFWVVERGGELVACCSAEIFNQICEIRSLVVKAEEEGKGLGTRLVRHCIDDVKERDIQGIVAITEHDGMFKRLGFFETRSLEDVLKFWWSNFSLSWIKRLFSLNVLEDAVANWSNQARKLMVLDLDDNGSLN